MRSCSRFSLHTTIGGEAPCSASAVGRSYRSKCSSENLAIDASLAAYLLLAISKGPPTADMLHIQDMVINREGVLYSGSSMPSSRRKGMQIQAAPSVKEF